MQVIFKILCYDCFKIADMAELADAHGSGPCESDFMQVQVLLPAPYRVFLQDLKRLCKRSVFLYLFYAVQGA